MEMNLAHFWAQGDLLTQAVTILLVLLSVASWCVIAAKAHSVWQARRCHGRALAAFWGADARSLPKMIGAYQVIKELGRGGMGVVLLAYHPQEQRKVAIKLISARHAQGSALWRFRREFRAMQQLNHLG